MTGILCNLHTETTVGKSIMFSGVAEKANAAVLDVMDASISHGSMPRTPVLVKNDIGNGQDKVHVQVFGVPLDGFFGVFAAVSGVVNSAYFHDFPLGVYLKGATSNLITF